MFAHAVEDEALALRPSDYGATVKVTLVSCKVTGTTWRASSPRQLA